MRGATRFFSREKQVFLVGFSLTFPRLPRKFKNDEILYTQCIKLMGCNSVIRFMCLILSFRQLLLLEIFYCKYQIIITNNQQLQINERSGFKIRLFCLRPLETNLESFANSSRCVFQFTNQKPSMNAYTLRRRI